MASGLHLRRRTFRLTRFAVKRLNLIVACAENRVIGRGRKLPWHIPEDLNFFHDQTAGAICIMGRICFDTWPRATKDGRRAIVLTHRPLPQARAGENPAIAVRSFADAVGHAETLPGEILVCGGERIYEDALALAGKRPLRLLLTLVHADISGDTFFPEWRHLPWREVARRESADANYRYTFLTLES